MVYCRLKATADRTPYDTAVIEKLPHFDYYGFLKSRGMNPVVFADVKNYLEKGEVWELYGCAVQEAASLLENEGYFDWHQNPIYAKGIIINSGWIILLVMFSWFFSFKRCLHHLKKKEIKAVESGLKKEPLELDKGDCTVLFTENKQLPQFLYNTATGAIRKLRGNRFCEEVLLDGVNICKEKNKKPVLYISIPGSFPGDMQVIDFIKFIFHRHKIKGPGRKMILEDEKIKPLLQKSIKHLKAHERFELVYLVLKSNKKKSYVYLIDDTEEILPDHCLLRLNQLFEQLKEEGVVIYITQPQVVGMDSLNPGECFVDGKVWFEQIKKIKKVSEVRKIMKTQEGSK